MWGGWAGGRGECGTGNAQSPGLGTARLGTRGEQEKGVGGGGRAEKGSRSKRQDDFTFLSPAVSEAGTNGTPILAHFSTSHSWPGGTEPCRAQPAPLLLRGDDGSTSRGHELPCSPGSILHHWCMAAVLEPRAVPGKLWLPCPMLPAGMAQMCQP